MYEITELLEYFFNSALVKISLCFYHLIRTQWLIIDRLILYVHEILLHSFSKIKLIARTCISSIVLIGSARNVLVVFEHVDNLLLTENT